MGEQETSIWEGWESKNLNTEVINTIMLKLTTNMTEPFAAETNSVYYAFCKCLE